MTKDDVVNLLMTKLGDYAKMYVVHVVGSNIYVYSSGFVEELDPIEMDIYSVFTVINGEVVKDVYKLYNMEE